jgi:nitroimidazol reductase NimA-like FMN-containing flavoprotein (pyridoxamine 5'-phosphate oxidase superfamily)
MGERIILHGAKASRLIRHVQAGNEICITVTLLDGLVLARSAFHHSMNYRSAVLFGKGEAIEDEAERTAALKVLSDHVMPGRWEDVRKPNKVEMAQTTVVAIAIDDASAKIRTGPPGDEPEDYDLPVWAGVLPLELQTLEPNPDPQLREHVPVPDYVRTFLR